MPWGVAAAVGGALVGGVMSNKAAGKQADATDRATNAQVDAQNKALEMQQPWVDAGKNALQRLEAGSAAGGEFRAPQYNALTADAFQKSPGFDYTMQESMKALNYRAAAGGNALGGAQMQALQDRGTQLANQEFNNAHQRNAFDWGVKMKEIGFNLGQTQSLAQVGQSATNIGSDLVTSTGNSLAAGHVAQGNISANQITGTANSAINGALTGYGLFKEFGKTPGSTSSATKPFSAGANPYIDGASNGFEG
jgi:hypothetical protein